MQYGVCGGPDLARVAKDCGYDYFEWSVGELLHPREDESIFEEALARAKNAGLPCPAANVFIPADLKITGPSVDTPALQRFVSTALSRAERAGVERIVFGSGGARRIPDGFDPTHAWQQLVQFCRWMGPVAQRHGVTVVVEPLNRAETNVINTVGDGAELVRQSGHPNIRLLVDGYHWAKDGDALEGILDNAALLAHAHIATVEGRRPPRPGDDCATFIAALKQAGYNQRVSIEGNIANPVEELPQALKVMKALWK
jgi:sugar phosphate isomerase/epimerase